MDVSHLQKVSATEWRLEPHGAMRVPAVFYADEKLIAEMDDKVLEQIGNVACLPGIVDAAYTMPDAHWGYGFPIGGVAAFDPERGRRHFGWRRRFRHLLRRTHAADRAQARPMWSSCKEAWPTRSLRSIPAGLGSTGKIRPRRDRDGPHARRRRALGGRARLRSRRGSRPHRGRGRDGRRPARCRVRIGRGSASARRWARSVRAITISKCRRSRRYAMTRSPQASGLAHGRCRRQHPLRLARARSPDRHRFSARDGDCGAGARDRACPIGNSPARRSARSSASAISARCAPASIARSPTARSSLI